jgi:hypothetical protein
VFVSLLEFVLQDRFAAEDCEQGRALICPISACLDNLCSARLKEIELNIFCAKFAQLWTKIVSSEDLTRGKT